MSAAEKTAPSIKDIANMPFPASVKAMRQYYNSSWGKDIGDGVKKTFRCRVGYSVRDSDTVDIEAFTKDEAEDLACEKVAKDIAGQLCISEFDVGIEGVDAREVAE